MGGWDSMSNWGGLGTSFGMGFGGGLVFGPIMLLLILWTLYWKYRSLWHAAKNDEKGWFIALLIINTLGILEILYLYFFSKKALKHNEQTVPMVPPQSGM